MAKKIEIAPEEMKTYVKIPFEPAPRDPSWLLKKYSGKKMNPLESEEYFKHIFEEDHRLIL